MKKRNSLKKYFALILMFFTIVIGFSNWIIVGEKNVNVGKVPSTRGVAYINSETSTLYTSIEGALHKAVSGDVVHVVLNTTDPAVINYDCEVKSGVTLNISYEQGYLQEENSNGIVEAILTYSDPTDEDDGNANTDPAYAGISALASNLKNVVKVNDGVTITNNGTIVVSGELSGSGGGQAYCGQTARNYAKLVMGSNSVINNYGSIRCCGFIEESSNNNESIINNYSGSTLRVPFILRDFRGGNTSYALYKVFDSKNVSPFNQFEINNIHCKIRVKYGSLMSCYTNINAGGGIQKTLIGFIGNDSSYFISLYNENKSDYENYYADIKYNKSTQVCNYDLFGGAKINKLAININVSLVGDLSLSTEQVYFPMSWRMNLTMNKYTNQEGNAIFNAESQKIKIMTGSSLIVNEGCEFISNNLIVYSFFRDRGYVGSSNIGGTTYENKNPGIFKVYGKYTTTGSFAGLLIKGAKSEISIASSEITTYEALYQERPTLSMFYDITQWTIISEVKTEILESEFNNKNRVTIGVIRADTWGTPTYQVSGGYTLSTSTSHNVNFFLSSGSTFTPKLLTNILTATYNGSYYVNGRTISVTSTSTFIIKASTSAIGNVANTSISISGNSTLIKGESSTFIATTNSSAYTKTFTWSSADPTIASVNTSTGVVTGVEIGTTYIYAYTNDDIKFKSEAFEVTVISNETVIPVSYFELSPDKDTSGAGESLDTTVNIVNMTADATFVDISWVCSGATTITPASDKRSARIVLPANTNEDKTYLLTVTITNSVEPLTVSKSIELYTKKKSNVCFARGTLVTLQDGSQKPIEDIKISDKIMTFNHNTGMYEGKKVFIKVNHGYDLYEVTKLTFSDGTVLKLIGAHGIFNLDIKGYSNISSESAYSLIGNKFFKYDSSDNNYINDYVTLVSVDVIKEYTESYTIVSEYNTNHILNGILSDNTAVRGMYNIFELDDSLKYDSELMKQDIEKYGLYEYSEFEEYTTQEVFDKFNMKYYKVSVGKGNMTKEDVILIMTLYNQCLENGELEK